jgi:hypothetical protein
MALGSGMPEICGVLPPARPWCPPERRPARAACMLALAHEIEHGLSRALFTSAEEVARLLGVTGARISRLLRLTQLAPDIQEEILFLEAIDGCEPIHEKWLCDRVAIHRAWDRQREVWRAASPPRRRYAPNAAELTFRRRKGRLPLNHFSRANEPPPRAPGA